MKTKGKFMIDINKIQYYYDFDKRLWIASLAEDSVIKAQGRTKKNAMRHLKRIHWLLNSWYILEK